jgi:hypothetical protein
LQENKELTVEGSKNSRLQRWQNLKNKDGADNKPNQTQQSPLIQLATILKLKMSIKPTHPTCNNPKNEEEVNMDMLLYMNLSPKVQELSATPQQSRTRWKHPATHIHSKAYKNRAPNITLHHFSSA